VTEELDKVVREKDVASASLPESEEALTPESQESTPTTEILDGESIEVPSARSLTLIKAAKVKRSIDLSKIHVLSTWRKTFLWIGGVASVIGILWMKKINIDFFWYEPATNLYSLLVIGYILSRFVIAYWDKRVAKKSDRSETLPSISIVIAAKNEEVAIFRTVSTCFASHYPKNLLQVIVVNDGSTDKTLEEMKRAQELFPDLKIISFMINHGKRRCMAAGTQVATGELLVFVDSDSFIGSDALVRIVEPFGDSDVVAVTGRTDVDNWHINLLTRMQAFRYYVAFKLMKRAESIFGCVTCCPGCFSAYRKSDLKAILGPWLHQRFLGKNATFGDDRSLTTILLRTNRKIIYADEATCTTIVPEKWGQYLKQQVRWKKSWIRETFIASSFMWKKHPIMALSFYLAALFPFVTPIITFNNLVYQPFWNRQAPIFYALGLLLICSLFSIYYRLHRSDGLWFHGIIYSVLYVVFLVWQMPYAILTLRKTSWGTR